MPEQMVPDQTELFVDGKPVMVPCGSTVAVAIAQTGGVCRRSVTEEPRGPVCGMGICFECRVIIDGIAHRRSCQILCQPGMDVRTHA